MSLTQTLRKVLTGQQDHAGEAAKAYDTLTKATADGKEPEPAAVSDILHAARKTAEDLGQAVETEDRRRKWRSEIALAAELEGERAGIEEAAQTLNDELKRAEEERETKMQPLRSRIREIDQAQSTAETATDELVKTCPNPELVEKLAKTRQTHSELTTRRFSLQNEIKDATRRLEWWRQGPGCYDAAAQPIGPHGYKAQEIEAGIKRATDKIEAAEAELPEIAKGLGAAELKERHLLEQMREV